MTRAQISFHRVTKLGGRSTGPVARLALDDNGRRMMVVGDDANLRIYDVATRTQLGDPIDLNEPSNAAAIRGDGLQVAAAVGQASRVLGPRPARWIEGACQLAGRNLTRAEWDQYVGDLAPTDQPAPLTPPTHRPSDITRQRCEF